jgi:hypothetical protein
MWLENLLPRTFSVVYAYLESIPVQAYWMLGVVLGCNLAYVVYEVLSKRHLAKRKAKFHEAIRDGQERWMTTPEQENIEKVLMGDIITDAVEDLVYQGKMSRDRARVWYRRYGNLLNLPDLLQKHELLLKERIRASLNKHQNIVQFPDTRPKSNGMVGRLMERAAAMKGID